MEKIERREIAVKYLLQVLEKLGPPGDVRLDHGGLQSKIKFGIPITGKIYIP